MKNTKFALGVTAFLLAIAGAVASKASAKTSFLTGYTFNGTSVSTPCDNTGPSICYDVNGRTLFTAPNKKTNSQVKTMLDRF
jgi:hypothetical protein